MSKEHPKHLSENENVIEIEFENEFKKALKKFREKKETAGLNEYTNEFSNKFLTEVDLFIESMKNIEYKDKKAKELDKKIVELTEKGNFAEIVMKAIETEEKYMRIYEKPYNDHFFFGNNWTKSYLNERGSENLKKSIEFKNLQLSAAEFLEKKSYFLNLYRMRLAQSRLISFARDCSVFPLLEDTFENGKINNQHKNTYPGSISKGVINISDFLTNEKWIDIEITKEELRDWYGQKGVKKYKLYTGHLIDIWSSFLVEIYKLMSKIFLSATNPGFYWCEDSDLEELRKINESHFWILGRNDLWPKRRINIKRISELCKEINKETWNEFNNVFVYNFPLTRAFCLGQISKTLMAITENKLENSFYEVMPKRNYVISNENNFVKRKVKMKDLMLILNPEDLEEINKNKELDLSKEISQGLSVYGDYSVNSGNYKILQRGMFRIIYC